MLAVHEQIADPVYANNKTQVFVEQIKVKQAELASWALDLTTTESKQLQHAEYQEDINDAVAELEKLNNEETKPKKRLSTAQQKADEAKTTRMTSLPENSY
ncbi:hypothetical protein MJO29_005426 [Puccinia striiformis f. sp. tritici]|nr:hypothetical protein MJO29_005426 [Puccinia striiformis f. sp. tritici]